MSTRGTGYRAPRWALPGELAAFEGGRTGRRTVRDWLADAGLFTFAVLYWLWAWDEYVTYPDPEFAAVVEDWMLVVDPWLGGAACLLLWWRRRFPLAVTIAMAAALMVSSTVTGAALVAVFTVAIHRRWLPATLATAIMVAQGVWFSLVYQPGDIPVPMFMVWVVMTFLIPLGWGMMIRLRRQLVVSLQRDAQREREEHARQLAETRRAERERIAREMHDVLAHRISLLSVHAGALAYRTAQSRDGAGEALTGGEVAEAITVIRDNAHRALTELGDVLSVLRADDAAADRGAPPPLLTDIPRLVEETRAVGQPVTLDLDGAGPDPPRRQEQRTAYRVVQEGLTNARKHAPGAQVAVRVAGAPGAGLEVAVTNPLPLGVTAVEIPGAGAGLTGLAERVALDGGTLEHGAVNGSFRLAAHLPWRT